MSSRATMQAVFLLVYMASSASCFKQMTNQLQRCKLLASIATRPVCPGRCWRASLDSVGRGSRDRANDPYERLLREGSSGRAFATKTWLSLPRVFVLLSAGTSSMKIHCQKKEDGVHDFGYGYPAPVFVDSIVVFESRADAGNYAQRLRNQTRMVFEVEPVEPRRVLFFAAQSGCKTSFFHAGAKSSVPEMRSAEAMKFKFWGGDVTASERPWNTDDDDFPRPTDENRRFHGKSVEVVDPNGRRKASELGEQTALGSHSKDQQKEDAHSNRAETAKPDSKGPLIKSQQPLPDKRQWGADVPQTRPGRAESPMSLDSVAAALKRGAPKRSADGQRWLVLPHVFVLITVPSPATGRPFIYTLREEKGFYDPGYGMGPRTPAFVDHLMAFEDMQDAARYARLVDARSHYGDSAVSLWVEQKGAEITPPADNAEGSVTSSTRRPWNPVDRLMFDQTLLQANGVEHWDGAMDYEEERERLEILIRRPHDR